MLVHREGVLRNMMKEKLIKQKCKKHLKWATTQDMKRGRRIPGNALKESKKMQRFSSVVTEDCDAYADTATTNGSDAAVL